MREKTLGNKLHQKSENERRRLQLLLTWLLEEQFVLDARQ